MWVPGPDQTWLLTGGARKVVSCIVRRHGSVGDGGDDEGSCPCYCSVRLSFEPSLTLVPSSGSPPARTPLAERGLVLPHGHPTPETRVSSP